MQLLVASPRAKFASADFLLLQASSGYSGVASQLASCGVLVTAATQPDNNVTGRGNKELQTAMQKIRLSAQDDRLTSTCILGLQKLVVTLLPKSIRTDVNFVTQLHNLLSFLRMPS